MDGNEPWDRKTIRSFDQLGKLTRRSNERGRRRPDVDKKRRNEGHDSARVEQTNVLFLPILAKVQGLKDNGFGFATTGSKNSVFFHRYGALKRESFDALKEGDDILALIGSDPKKPDRKQIVRWMPSHGVVWEQNQPADQAEWDMVRRRGLAACVPRLESVLRPRWYTGKWGDESPPPDLEDDLLRDLVLEHVGSLAPDELARLDLPAIAASALYDFAPCLDVTHPKAAVLLDHVSDDRLPLLGRPGFRLLEAVSEGKRARATLWFVRAGGAEAQEDERRRILTGWNAWEAEAASMAIASNLPLEAGLLRWLHDLQKNDLFPEGILDDRVEKDGPRALRYATLLTEPARDALMIRVSSDETSRAEAATLQPDLASEIAWRSALAFDLESDGRETRQIGIATAAGTCLTFDGEEPDARQAALTDLRRRLSDAPLIVGHNVLNWDLEIVGRDEAAPTATRPVWDTLLVSFLLDPAAATHALHGAHRADEDAADTLALFRKQLDRLPEAFAVSLLSDPPVSSASLVARISDALEGTPLKPKARPSWVEDAAPDLDRPILAPRHAIDALAWADGVDVAPPPGGASLSVELLVLEEDALCVEPAIDPGSDPRAAILVGLAGRCEAAGIALRVGMLPGWLTGDKLHAAVRRSARAARGSGRTVCLMPPAGPWWDGFDAKALRVLSWSGETCLVPVAGDPKAVSSFATIERRGLLWDGDGRCWLRPDPIADRLEARHAARAIAAIRLPAQAVVRPEAASATVVPLVPERTAFRLGPDSFDAAAYWTDVIGEVASAKEPGEVRALLVGSSDSKEFSKLLETALARIGHGMVREDHVSRSEHLRRVARNDGVVILPMEDWRDWHRLAQAQCIVLRPLVEALPVEAWHVLTHGVPVDPKGTPPSVTRTDIARELTATAGKHLESWLQESGLADAEVAPIVLDPRAVDLVRPLRGRLALRPALATLPNGDRSKITDVLEPLAIRREEAPSDPASMEAFLVKHWQPPGEGGNAVTGFKPTQTEAMRAILTRGEDVVVTLPTGEGKSVLFQVPALCRGLRDRRLTLVLSPLRALMRDQVERLRVQGFEPSVDYLNADRPAHEKTEILEGLLDHRLVLLYVAPERLRDPIFRDVLRRRMEADEGLERLVLDEAHCLNQWGFEFRPDYFFAMREVLGWAERIANPNDLISQISRIFSPDATQSKVAAPVLMLSATHTAADRDALGTILKAARGLGPDVPLLPMPEPDKQPHPLRDHIEITTKRMEGAILSRREFERGLPERMTHVEDIVRGAVENRARTGQRSGVLIFVTRRAHAEAIASQIAAATGARSEAFHAGLDAGLREQLVEEFREGEIDVLVATKAFGMGMDIPDIHYVLHLSPPAYLEDYLQEVGRIGRGARERKAAGLTRLPATLLWADADFATARDLRKRNEITPASIRDFHAGLKQRSTKDRIIVPAHGFEAYKSEGEKRALETRCRMSLHWLEEAERATIAGMVSASLPVTLHRDALRRVSAEETEQGRAARALLALPRADGPAEAEDTDMERGPILLDVAKLGQACGCVGKDGPIGALSALQKRGAVKIKWDLTVSPLRLWKEPPEQTDALIDAVEAGIEALLKLAIQPDAGVDPTALMEEAFTVVRGEDLPTSEDDPWADVTDNVRRSFQDAWTWALKSLALSCGIKLRQAFRKEGPAWGIHLAPERHDEQKRRARRLLNAVRRLILQMRALDDAPKTTDAGDLVELVREADRGFRSHDLDAVLRLASALRQLSVRGELVPTHYEIALHGEGLGLDDRSELADRLASVNALAEARLTVMEAFCLMPPEARDAFVRDYMTCRDAEAVETVLARHLGDVAGLDAGLSSSVERLLARYRGTAAEEHFARFRSSEEPAQWTAITHPYDRSMLVNAGPGAGKTAVLVARIVHLLHVQGLRPDQILVLAFNRAVVQEIRRRVAAVFRDLGYGAYTRDLRVDTFHGLATRQLGERRRKKGNPDSLTALSNQLRLRPYLAIEMSKGCRAILVDEFQDANDAIFGIVERLAKAAGAAVFAIGDDDQDITRWNRPGGEFSEVYFDRFERAFNLQPQDRLALTVNFRSGREIVESSERFLATVLGRSAVSKRLKVTALKPQANAPDSTWEMEDCRNLAWPQVVSLIQNRLEAIPEGRSIAVLCRSNADVACLEGPLREVMPALKVQRRNGAGRFAEKRHVGFWLDHLERRIAQEDDPATPKLRDALLLEFRRTVRIPETVEDGEALRTLAALWDRVMEDDPKARLSDVADLLRGGLRSDDVDRLLGGGVDRILSTIHKVKGLEFDEVIVVPSTAAFPMGNDDVDRAVAEEARTFYVAATRAKERLRFLYGAREAAWLGAKPWEWEGSGGAKLLEGKTDEVNLGWSSYERSGRNSGFDHTELHGYFEERVVIGDPIILGGYGRGAGRVLFHSDNGIRREIGMLANDIEAGSAGADLRVADVIRVALDAAPRWAPGRAWAYAVLVEGRLR